MVAEVGTTVIAVSTYCSRGRRSTRKCSIHSSSSWNSSRSSGKSVIDVAIVAAEAAKTGVVIVVVAATVIVIVTVVVSCSCYGSRMNGLCY